MRARGASGLAYQRPAGSARRQPCMMSLRLTGEGGAGIYREPCEAICKSLAACFARGWLRAAGGRGGRDAAVQSCLRCAGANRGVGPEMIVWHEQEISFIKPPRQHQLITSRWRAPSGTASTTSRRSKVPKAPSCRRAIASRYVSVTWSVARMRLASTCSRSSRLRPLDQKMWPG